MASSIQSLVIDGIKEWFGGAVQAIHDWLSQPHIIAPMIAWTMTVIVVCTLALCLGFERKGPGPRTSAAAFQSKVYGGFVPAGGIFAALTSMGMLGTLRPAAAILAVVLATMVAFIVWAYGIGR